MTNRKFKSKDKKIKLKMPVRKPIPVTVVQADHGVKVIFSLRRAESPILWSGLLTPDPKAFEESRPDYLLHLRSIKSDFFGISDIQLCLGRVGMWLKNYLHLAEDTPVPIITIVDRSGVFTPSTTAPPG